MCWQREKMNMGKSESEIIKYVERIVFCFLDNLANAIDRGNIYLYAFVHYAPMRELSFTRMKQFARSYRDGVNEITAK